MKSAVAAAAAQLAAGKRKAEMNGGVPKKQKQVGHADCIATELLVKIKAFTFILSAFRLLKECLYTAGIAFILIVCAFTLTVITIDLSVSSY